MSTETRPGRVRPESTSVRNHLGVLTALILCGITAPVEAAGLDSHIVYNRGLPLWEVISTVQVSSGSSVWMVDGSSAGATPTRLTPEETASSLMPSWSPGKSAVVFSSNRLNDDGTASPPLDLWSVDADGGDPVRLTSTSGHNWTPAWSPDGSRIAFASTRRAPVGELDETWRFDLFVMNADGSDQRCLYDGGLQDEDPVFSGDGGTVYFVSEQPECFQLWQVPTDDAGGCSGGGSAEPVRDAAGTPICGEDPSLSPDGETLLFGFQGQLAALDLASGAVSVYGWVEEPWISPGGDRFCHVAGGDIYTQDVTDVDGASAIQVTSTGDVFFPRWAAPGEGELTLGHTSWLEIAAHLPGELDSQWRTDLVVQSQSAAMATVELVLHAGPDLVSYSGTVPGGAQGVFADIVGLMGFTGKGTLEIRSDQPIRSSARIYNQADEGSFGQFLDAFERADGLTAGQSAWLLQLRQAGGGFRTNISVTNTGTATARVRITLFATEGTSLTDYELMVDPGQLVQDLEPFRNRAGQADLGWGFARLEVLDGGGVLASASVIDSGTNDATTVPMKR